LYCKLKLLKLRGEGKVAMKTCGMELEHHIFLTTTLDEGQWSAAFFTALPSQRTQRCPMYNRLHGPQIWSRHSGSKEKFPDLARNWTHTSSHDGLSYAGS